MTIKITRKTGIGSGITPVKIRIENEEIVKLDNHQSHFFMPKMEKTKVYVTDWFYGSQEAVLENSNDVIVRINRKALILNYSMFPFLFLGLLATSWVSTVIALILCLASFFYSRKHWFEFVKIK
ncbi:hypothetical protein H8978_002352 [Listeria monocytogenes]|uniref:hypothetical protein n=1 Tax=Listeria monocytogenes TaxID=1639 RepID=UPI0001697990|nr:hypothetical protein [Listeria monocytogenes]EFD91662.1 conserved hypothetical protein [Listeria monocytogenes FSL J2-071]ALQ17916.1 hypothetical protein ATE43_13465 [Listeria monocytogenes]ALQ19470.1 hypothetical protein ATE44_07515 [Listeria monocytogenes]AYY70728.1 hypothetical protein EGX77_05965 [Listeria monocytogenes]EAC2870771.1 hypothetical protein [Listeria monocytogenes]